MHTTLKKATEKQASNIVYLCDEHTGFDQLELSGQVVQMLESERNKGKKLLIAKQEGINFIVFPLEKKGENYKTIEYCRVQGNELLKILNADKAEEVLLISCTNNNQQLLAFAEGMALGNYQFLKYFTDADKRKNSLQHIKIWSDTISEGDLSELQDVINHTLWARSLVNEPASFLTAEQLSEELHQKGVELGFKVEVFNKMKIESLRMGGLLAVNR
nr:hypothetical protein [Bacteroidota bacterium]